MKMNKSKLTELLRYAWLEGRTNGLQNNGKSFSEFLELKEVSEAINYTHCCESDSEQFTPNDVKLPKENKPISMHTDSKKPLNKKV